MTLGPLMVDLEGVTISDTEKELLLKPEVGGVILFTRNFESVEQITALVREIHSLRTPGLLVAVDHERPGSPSSACLSRRHPTPPRGSKDWSGPDDSPRGHGAAARSTGFAGGPITLRREQ